MTITATHGLTPLVSARQRTDLMETRRALQALRVVVFALPDDVTYRGRLLSLLGEMLRANAEQLRDERFVIVPLAESR